jgi:hypothetical protein
MLGASWTNEKVVKRIGAKSVVGKIKARAIFGRQFEAHS